MNISGTMDASTAGSLLSPRLSVQILYLRNYWAYICVCVCACVYTGRFIMFFVITNIYNKKTKGPTLMEVFTATGKLKKFF
jgi:hypothetical protein